MRTARQRRHGVLLLALCLVAGACATGDDSLQVSGAAVHRSADSPDLIDVDTGGDRGDGDGRDGVGSSGDPTDPGGGGTGSNGATGSDQGGLLPVGGPVGSGGGGDGGEAPEPIVLGTVLPLQGGQRDFGVPILKTTQAFVDEVNSRGGLLGRPIELIAYNACLLCQDEALQAVRRLVEEDGVSAIVNTYVMVVAFQPVIPYLVDKGIPLIQGGAENQTSDALSPVNFATAPTGQFYLRALPEMARRKGITAIGITYLDVPSEANGVPILEEEFAKYGIEVVRTEPIGAAEEAVTNMDAAVTRMRAAGADGVLATNPVLVIYGRLGADRQNWQVPWVGPAAWSRLVEDSCGVVCDELVLTDTAGLSWVERDSPQMRQYVDTMALRYPGGELSGHTLAAWVGMQLWAEVVVRAGTDAPAAFLEAIHTVRDLDLGTTSPLTFTPDKHLGGSLTVLLELVDGRYAAVSEPITWGEGPR